VLVVADVRVAGAVGSGVEHDGPGERGLAEHGRGVAAPYSDG
jgi:hypothetical protein